MNKILIIANDFTAIYHFRMELLRYLIQQGYKVVVALPDDERNLIIEEVGVQLVDLPLSRFGTNPFVDMKTMFYIRKLILVEKPLIVLTYTAKPNIYGGMACRLTKTPYVCNVTGLGANFDKKNFISRIMMMLQKVAYKSAATVFFQNTSNKQFFEDKHIVSNNGALLPGSGVNLEENSFVEYPSNTVLKFIAIARIRQDKGYDELFEVIKRLHNEGIKAEFHIVGWYEDDSYRSLVQQMKEQYGVRFYENVLHKDVHKLIAECDCLIQPSHHEGMSNVILEAAATGRPCIVSDIHGCKEGVDDGVTGFWFKVKDAERLYQTTCNFIAMPQEKRRTMGIKGHEKMRQEFDRQIVINKYMQIIKKYEDGKNESI